MAARMAVTTAEAAAAAVAPTGGAILKQFAHTPTYSTTAHRHTSATRLLFLRPRTS